MFNCTAYGIPITWSVFTPNMNYTNLEIINDQVHSHSESMDGVIMADLISLDVSTMPITVVSSLTVNVRAELEGSIVECSGFTASEQNTKIKSFIHVIGEYNKVPEYQIKRCIYVVIILVLLKVKLHFLRALSVH